MNKSLFYQYLNFPELLDDRSLIEIEKILEEYPYFQSVRLLHIKNLSNQGSISYDRELKRTAVWVTDRQKLFYLLDNRVLLPIDDFTEPQHLELPKVLADNIETIDFSTLTEHTNFEDKKDFAKKANEQNDELSQLIMSGSAQASTFFNVDDKVDLEDFMSTFKKNSSKENKETSKVDTNADRQKRLIDNFIIEQPSIARKKEDDKEEKVFTPQPIKDEPDMITDTLAKIYIKQEKFDKAILAYEKLSLKYPEKKIYFAGQIKKIKQLINNQ